MIETVTLETLPKAFLELYREIVEMKQLIQDQKELSQPKHEAMMTVEETATFLKLSRYTIYGLVSQGVIPFMKKGKRLYFSSEDLTIWLKSSRKQKH